MSRVERVVKYELTPRHNNQRLHVAAGILAVDHRGSLGVDHSNLGRVRLGSTNLSPGVDGRSHHRNGLVDGRTYSGVAENFVLLLVISQQEGRGEVHRSGVHQKEGCANCEANKIQSLKTIRTNLHQIFSIDSIASSIIVVKNR